MNPTDRVVVELDRDDGMTYFFHEPNSELKLTGLCKMHLSRKDYDRYQKIERDYFQMQEELEAYYFKVKEARKKGNKFI